MTMPLEPHILDMFEYLAERTRMYVTGQRLGLNSLQIHFSNGNVGRSFIISANADTADLQKLVKIVREESKESSKLREMQTIFENFRDQMERISRARVVNVPIPDWSSSDGFRIEFTREERGRPFGFRRSFHYEELTERNLLRTAQEARDRLDHEGEIIKTIAAACSQEPPPPPLHTRLARALLDLERKRPTIQGLTPWQPYRLAQGALDGVDDLDQRPAAAQGADGIYARRAIAISRHAIRRMMGKTL